MKIVRLALSGAILILAGCAAPTPAERAARAGAEMQQLVQVYGPACEQLGYRRDDDKWRECILHMSLRDEYRNSRRPVSTTCFGQRGFFDCTTM